MINNITEILDALPEYAYCSSNKFFSRKVNAPIGNIVFGRLVYIKHKDKIIVSKLEYTYDNENNKLIVYLYIRGQICDIKIPIDVRYTKTPEQTLKDLRNEYRISLPKVDGLEFSFQPCDFL